MTKRKGQVKETSGSNAGWLAVILCLHVTLAIVYWAYTPYGASPDEQPHGRYVGALASNWSLPVFDEADRGNYEYHQPPLYYVTGVPFYLAARAARMTEPAEMVRLLSLVLGGLAVVLVYGAVRSAFPEKEGLALACSGFVAFLPTHSMLSSSVSNDVLVEVVVGLALLVTARMLAGGLNWARTAGLGVVLGVGLLTKTTCVVLFPVALIAYVLVWRRGKSTAKLAAGHLAAAVGISLALGGWWLARNQILYGDVLAMAQFQHVFQDTPTPDFWLSRGWSWATYFGLVGVWTFGSFWGVFGHMNVFMPVWTYCALGAVSAAVAIGSVRGVLGVRAKSSVARDVLLVYGVLVLLVLLVFVKFNVMFFQAQGRYLYPALIPISVLWALGMERLLPGSKRRFTPWLAVGVPLVAQIVALAACVVPEMPYYI